MNNTVFVELKFWLLLFFSILLPFSIYAILLTKRAVSRNTILFFGFIMVAISSIDFYLLRQLSTLSKFTSSLQDDMFFTSELSVALYILPILFAGIGVNMVSHVLIRHLDDAENRFEKENMSEK
jgi:hypothetical protein